MKTKAELEGEISRAVIRFEKEHMGRGPLETKTWIIDDVVLIRLKGVLIPAEMKLAQSEQNWQGRDLIKRMRQLLIEEGRPLLDAVVKDILGIAVISLHTDISTRTGERMIVLTLENRPTFR